MVPFDTRGNGQMDSTPSGIIRLPLKRLGWKKVEEYIPSQYASTTLSLDAIVDSGASDVSVPADIVSTLIRTKTVTQEDFLGKQTYVLADGSKVPSQQFRIRSLKVGNKIIDNVVASIASVKGDILLGQSFLSKFKSWSVDNEQHSLILQ